jgi:hypothetical protein
MQRPPPRHAVGGGGPSQVAAARDGGSRSVRVFSYLHGGDEAVAAPGDIYNEPVAIAPITQRATQRGNMDRKVGRFDKDVRPNPTHQLLLAD